MHELAISRAILETALIHAEERRVRRIEVTIGALRQVVPSSLEFYLEAVARGTLCEGAELVCRLAPARLRCTCGERWELRELDFACPRCAEGRVQVLDGEQLLVDCIEVEEEEAACTVRR
ncbi:MAG TPA: hydrogenase maturation nickel metallochaperone HypA [Solirubrobacteraceae bacterium]|nr:hydrogenase maturation nickel metallochaperone HypA [Solirubrobacteraceae bacterium]